MIFKCDNTFHNTGMNSVSTKEISNCGISLKRVNENTVDMDRARCFSHDA